MLRRVVVYYNLMLPTNKIVVENFKVKLDVLITILEFLKIDSICAYLMTSMIICW